MIHLFIKLFLSTILAVFALPLETGGATGQASMEEKAGFLISTSEALQAILREGLPAINAFSGYYLQMAGAIVLVSVVLMAFRSVQERRNNQPFEGAPHVANWIVLLLLSALELFYALAMGKDATWFCNPYKAGWLWVIPGFVAFAWIVYNQLMCLVNILGDLQHNSRAEFSLKPGVFSWIGGLLCLVICQIFYQPGLVVVLGLILLAQLVQVGVIFKNVTPVSGVWRAVIFSLVYLFGTFAMALLLMHFVAMLILVVVGFIVLMALGAGGGNETSGKPEVPRKKCPHCGTSRNLDGSYNCTCEYNRRKALRGE